MKNAIFFGCFWSPFSLQLDLVFHLFVFFFFKSSICPHHERGNGGIFRICSSHNTTHVEVVQVPHAVVKPLLCLIQTTLLKWAYLTHDEDSWVSSHRQNAAWTVVVVDVLLLLRLLSFSAFSHQQVASEHYCW